MKIKYNSLMWRFLNSNVMLFGINWEISTLRMVKSNPSIWMLVVACIIQTIMCVVIPVLYIFYGVIMLTPLCLAVGLLSGFVLLPNTIMTSVILGFLVPNGLTIIITMCTQGRVQQEYFRSIWQSICEATSNRWLAKACSTLVIPLVMIWSKGNRFWRIIANPIEIEIEENDD